MEPRVLIFAKTFGGLTTTFIYNEICELEQHIDLRVLTTHYMNQELFPFPSEKLAIIPIKESLTKKRIKHRLQKYNLELSEKNKEFGQHLANLISEYQPDLIHCHFGTHCFHIVDNLPDSSLPIFISFHGYDASEKLLHKVYRKRIKGLFEQKNIHPIFVSNFMKSSVEKYGLRPQNSHILYYGTDISLFQRNSRSHPKRPFTFFQLSRFSEKKGYPYTLQAFALFLKGRDSKNYRLVLAGDGPLLEEMKSLAQTLGIQEQVVFTGAVNQVEAREWMEQAHAFVHHSIVASNNDMEGIPNAIMEAMAMELPIISTYHSGIPELVQDGINGFLVQEKEVAAYAQRMQEIIEWDYLPQNRQRIQELFERKAHCEQLVDLYKKSLSHQPGEPGKARSYAQ